MKTTIKDDKLIIEIDLQSPEPSKSGKTLVVASTRGIITTDAKVNNRNVKVGLNAFIDR